MIRYHSAVQTISYMRFGALMVVNINLKSPAFQMETAESSKMLVPTPKYTDSHPKDCNLIMQLALSKSAY